MFGAHLCNQDFEKNFFAQETLNSRISIFLEAEEKIIASSKLSPNFGKTFILMGTAEPFDTFPNHQIQILRGILSF